MRKLASPVVILLLLCLGVSADTSTPISITSVGSALTEDFNSLASSGTSSVTPAGWGFAESSTNANTTYTANTGASNAGDTYSYGAAALPGDRALGTLQSGSLISTIGAQFTNNTGGTITALTITYAGEQWRLGAAGRVDRLDFQYSTNATGLTAGTYVDVDALDFTAPVTTGTLGNLDGNASINRTLISSTITGLNIANQASFFIRWTDFNASGADDGLAIDDFSLTASVSDGAPAVTGTAPAAGASNVPAGSAIVINFNESVTASPSAFAISCGGPVSFSQSASPAASFTLTPAAGLPPATHCTVSIAASQISDVDPNDPPDQMSGDVSFSFDTENPDVAVNVIINEIDSDTPGSGVDTAEFVELYDGGVGHTPLSGLTVVFYNGNGDVVYGAFDLDGFSTNGNGYFTLGNPGVPGVDLEFNPGASGFLQNGADAVALFVGNATSFPIGAPLSTVDLLDAVVYDTDDADDPGLLALLNAAQPQVNENGGADGPNQSIGRCENGTGGARNTSTYANITPTPDSANVCPPPPPPPSASVIVISQIYGGGGSSGAAYQNDYVELYNRGSVTVDTTGWSLQYASATGSGWDFNKTPLGGPIAPGQYYLIKLASNGANGAVLPAENVGGLINMSASQGKIAIVDNFDALVGNCPTANPHVRDLVGYGAADCAEGSVTAPAPSVSTALLRLNNGATDTDFNSLDLATGAPNPRRTAPIVELGPIVLDTDPSTNGLNAPRDPTIVITFTEPVFAVDPWFDISCSVSGQHNDHTLAGNGRILDITPNVNLTAGETCTVTIVGDRIHDQDSDDGPDTLAANYSWSFTVANGAPPPYPPAVHLTLGNPSDATSNIQQPENYLMQKPEYSLSYNRDLGRPNWVSWHLSPEWYGTLARVDTFRADPQVPPDWYRVQGFDFSGSGFDRGHMVPNADRDKETSIPINQATYLMTNMIAQAPGNNQGPWADLENDLRGIADGGNELYIIAGPEGVGGTGSAGDATTIAGGHVTVPARTWKVALVVPFGVDDLTRVTCATRTIAVIMPNIDSIREDDWRSYLTTVDAVESLTGYDFFMSLPEPIQRCVEAGIDGNNPPLDTDADSVPDSVDNCPANPNADQSDLDHDGIGDACDDMAPPVIRCGSADAFWHAGNVSIACTASDSFSGLSNPADASFVLTTSVAAGFEDSNASTDSRVVCDAAGNCVTAGPIAGNKIDRKNPEITLARPGNGDIYQLNDVITASFNCADTGSGIAACLGTFANNAAIDTLSSGPKSFTVTATDAVGNASSLTVSYSVSTGVAHKRTPGISIANLPASAKVGGSFTPSYLYDGDGITHLRSETPAVCKVKADDTVEFVGAGTCTLVSRATPTGSVNAAVGPSQSFEVSP
jgi:endonuclease G